MPVSARPGVILLSGSLYFQQVSVRDSGTYVCVVNNSAGEKRMESSLTVTGKLFPFFPYLLSNRFGIQFNSKSRGERNCVTDFLFVFYFYHREVYKSF